MDIPQSNPTNQQDAPDDMLPPVLQPAQNSGQPTAATPPSAPPSSMMQHDDSQQTVPSSRALIPVPEEAGDNDLIEKEWVLKAKQIVEHTAEDPFVQQQELSKIKADYMKKRYNKDLGTV